MADIEFKDLTAAASVVSTDIFPATTDIPGTPVDKKVSMSVLATYMTTAITSLTGMTGAISSPTSISVVNTAGGTLSSFRGAAGGLTYNLVFDADNSRATPAAFFRVSDATTNQTTPLSIFVASTGGGAATERIKIDPDLYVYFYQPLWNTLDIIAEGRVTTSKLAPLTSVSSTLKIHAYTDVGVQTDFITLTNAVTPTCDLSSSVTIGGNPIANGGANSNITSLSGLTGAVSKPTSITMATTGSIQTDVSSGNTMLLKAYDVDGAAYTTFATLTAGNTPTCDLSSAVTVGGNAIVTGGPNSSITTLTGLTGAVSKPTSITMANTGSIQTDVSAGNTMIVKAYDVDGAAYTDFITLTANNTPTMDFNTTATIGGNYIYRAGGTDVAVADGGTGSSTASGARTNLGAAASGANGDITSLTGLTGGISNPTYINVVNSTGGTYGSFRGTGSLLTYRILIDAWNGRSTPACYFEVSDASANYTTPFSIYLAASGIGQPAATERIKINPDTTIDLKQATSVTGNLSCSSQVYAANGSVSTPSYSFTNSVSTGLYIVSTNVFGFVSNGVKLGQLNTDGLSFITPVNSTVTGDYTVDLSDLGKRLLANSNSTITLTLPQQSTATTLAGFWFEVMNTGNADVNIVKQGTETITGNTLLAPGARCKIFRNTTTNWDVAGGTAVYVGNFSRSIATASVATFNVSIANTSGTLINVFSSCSSGLFTFKANINGTDCTMDAVNVTSGTTVYTGAVTGANDFNLNDNINVNISANTSALDLVVIFQYTYRQNIW